MWKAINVCSDVCTYIVAGGAVSVVVWAVIYVSNGLYKVHVLTNGESVMCGSCTQRTPYRHKICFPHVLLLCNVRSFLITHSCYFVACLRVGRRSSVGVATSLRIRRPGV